MLSKFIKMAVSKISKTVQFNVEEVLNDYKLNKCRLCGEQFCCPDCRVRHEGAAHKVNVDCTLCIYGFVILKKLIIPELIQHVIESHLLTVSRCVYCERQISADKIMNHKNSNCTFTNYTNAEMTKYWSKLPAEVREEYMKSCDSDNGVIITKDEFNSPSFDGVHRQQLFEKGEFANSTPVYGVPTNAESTEVETKNTESPSNSNDHQQIIIKKSDANMFEDSAKTRKVQFDVTPQPVTCKSPASFHFLAKKSAIKKNRIDSEADQATNSNILKIIELSSKSDRSQNVHCNDAVDSKEVNQDRLPEDKPSCHTERVTVPVKPMIRDLNKSVFVEAVNDTIFDDTEPTHWTTAIGDIPDYNSEISNSNNPFTSCDLDLSIANYAQETTSQNEPESLLSFQSNKQLEVNNDHDIKKTLTDIWVKYKSKVVEFTRTMKRPRSELEESIDKGEDAAPLNDHKRRRLTIRARRPIHYYIKPNVTRDIKKMNRGMQTSK